MSDSYPLLIQPVKLRVSAETLLVGRYTSHRSRSSLLLAAGVDDPLKTFTCSKTPRHLHVC